MINHDRPGPWTPERRRGVAWLTELGVFLGIRGVFKIQFSVLQV